MGYPSYDYTFEQYQADAESRQPHKDLGIYTLGLAGEAGEVCEIIKKHRGHGIRLDDAKLEEELGDALFYIAAIASSQGLSLERIARGNRDKIWKRYPNGFVLGGGNREAQP